MKGRGIILAVGVAALVASCARAKDGRGSASPATAYENAGAPADDLAAEGDVDGGDANGSLEELEDELVALESDLVSRGVVLPARDGPATENAQPKRADAGVPLVSETEPESCARVCDLRKAVCSLESKICSLADEHEGESRYAGVCERAKSDCQSASAACDGCSTP